MQMEFLKRMQAAILQPSPEQFWEYEEQAPVMPECFTTNFVNHVVSAIGVPIAVDKYTAEMCEKQKGRASYAIVLVEFSADQEIPKYTESKILGAVRKFRLEYNWTTPRCSHCKIFGHTFADCIRVRMAAAAPANQAGPLGTKVQVEDPDQGFHQPKRRRRPTKAKVTTGIHIKPKVWYVPKKVPEGKGKAVRLDTDNTQSFGFSCFIFSLRYTGPD